MSAPPPKRSLAGRAPTPRRPAWVGGAAWIGSLALHGGALAALTLVVVGAFRAEQSPPRLTVSQRTTPAAGAPLVAWAQPPALQPPEEPLEAPPDVPPLELEEPRPTAVPSGSRAAPKRVRAADAVRPLPQPRPRPAAPPIAAPAEPAPDAPPAEVAGAREPAAGPATTTARVRFRARPVRPSKCVRRGHVGTVVVELYVGVDGLPYHPKVARSSGCERLDKAVLAAVRRYRFHPATSGGQPVSSRERIVVRVQPQT